MRNTKAILLAVAATSTLMIAAPAVGDATMEKLNEMYKTRLVNAFVEPMVIEAVKSQNTKYQNLSQAEIDKLDNDWRQQAKAGSGPMIDSVLSNALSQHLKKMKEAGQGLYSEIFVMDNKGLNVGQSDVTSDFWQGDEAKFQKTYGAGVEGVLVDEVEFDESSQTYQSQISLTLVDPATNQAIGAVTVGVNIEALE